jgi:hypothetical protein
MRSERDLFSNVLSTGLVFAALAPSLFRPCVVHAAPRFDGLEAEKKPEAAAPRPDEAKKKAEESRKKAEEAKKETSTVDSRSSQFNLNSQAEGTSNTKASPSSAASSSTPAIAVTEKQKQKRESDGTGFFDRGYRHEWRFESGLDYTRASTKSKPNESALSENATTFDFNILYGYFIGELVQPVVELGYHKNKNNIGELNESSSRLTWGMGLLFNLPLEGEVTSASINVDRLVPFGGLLVLSESSSSRGNLLSTSTSSNENLMTNLVAGVRYMIFPHVSVNSSMRLSYEKSASAAEANASAGGERSKTRIQLRLLGFSLLM